MKAFIFIGPTIGESEARNWLDATYLPPVTQGDVASLLRLQPDVIGIIDGYFDQVPSAWHKEILLALSQGVTVVGAASMGALRAAELHPFGMVGIGQVFEWYRDGVIEADDEVAIRHAPAELEYRAVSEAMVNIRSTLAAACRETVIAESTRDALIQIGRDTLYGERSYSNLLARGLQAGLPEGEMTALEEYVRAHRIDQKKEDAIALLKYTASLTRDTRPPKVDFEIQRTWYLARLLDLDVFVRERVTIQEMMDFARLEEMDIPDVMEKAGRRKMLVSFARLLGFRVSEEERTKEMESFCKRYALATESDLQDWRARNDVTEQEHWALLEELTLERKTFHLFSTPRNHDVLWQLRLEGKYEASVAALNERAALLDESAPQATVSSEELLEFYKLKTGDQRARTLDEVVRKLGFGTKTGLLIELQKAYRVQAARQDAGAEGGGGN